MPPSGSNLAEPKNYPMNDYYFAALLVAAFRSPFRQTAVKLFYFFLSPLSEYVCVISKKGKLQTWFLGETGGRSQKRRRIIQTGFDKKRKKKSSPCNGPRAPFRPDPLIFPGFSTFSSSAQCQPSSGGVQIKTVPGGGEKQN